MDIYKAEAFPMINFGSGVSYMSSSIKSQGLSAGSIPPTIDRIDGYAANWSLSVQQPLITFGKVSSSLKLARHGRKTFDQAKKMQQDLFYLKVMNQFLTAYTAQLSRDIAVKSSQRSQRLYQKTKAEYETGRASKADYLRIEALTQSDRANLLKAAFQRNTSIRQLCVLIGMNDTANIVLTLESKGEYRNLPSSAGEKSIQTELKNLESELYRQQSAYFRSNMLPSISLSGSISNSFMIIDTTGLTQKISTPSFPFENPTFSDYLNPDFFNYSIGLQLNWNVFDGRRTGSQIRQAQYKSEKARLEYEQMLRENTIQIEENRNTVTTLDSMLEAIELNVIASEKAFQQTEFDYEKGMADITSYLEADENSRNAQLQRDNLRLQRILALANLRISMGLPVYGE